MDSYLTEKHVFADKTKEEHVMSIMRQDGLACCTCPIVYLLMTYKNVPMEEAVGVTALLWLLLMIALLLNDVPQHVGNSLKGICTNIAFFGFVTYSTILVETDEYAGSALKLFAGFGLTHSLALLLSPNFHALMWGNVQGDDDMLHFTRRCIGCDLFSVSAYLCALIAGVPNPKAAGISWMALFFAFLSLMGGFQKFKYDMKMIFGWVVCIAFFAVTLLADNPVVVETAEEGVKDV
ncbi:MAG: hypothetical protein SGARI_007279 [Bacillariaceae sp.]